MRSPGPVRLIQSDASDAKPETLLLVLAGTFAMLPQQLAALPPEIRERLSRLDPNGTIETIVRDATAWRDAALKLRALLQAESAAVTPEIQHGPAN